MEIRHAEAFGHDLHGLLGAADLRAVFEQQLTGFGDQLQHPLGFVQLGRPFVTSSQRISRFYHVFLCFPLLVFRVLDAMLFQPRMAACTWAKGSSVA